MLAILWASAEAGAVRFNEFKQTLEGIPPRTLAARLAELEEAGIVERRVFDTRPPRVEYRLTVAGGRLAGASSPRLPDLGRSAARLPRSRVPRAEALERPRLDLADALARHASSRPISSSDCGSGSPFRP